MVESTYPTLTEILFHAVLVRVIPYTDSCFHLYMMITGSQTALFRLGPDKNYTNWIKERTIMIDNID